MPRAKQDARGRGAQNAAPSGKRTGGEAETTHPSSPRADRPLIPPEYGIPQNNTGLLPWSHVDERMATARAYWIASVDENNRPHATPVDGLWMDGELYFGGDPRTRRSRNLAHNPAACVHLESGSDVVILHGEVRELRGMPRRLAERLGAASRAKYGYAPSVKEYQESAVQVFRPRVVFAWKQFPQDVTRWTLG